VEKKFIYGIRCSLKLYIPHLKIEIFLFQQYFSYTTNLFSYNFFDPDAWAPYSSSCGTTPTYPRRSVGPWVPSERKRISAQGCAGNPKRFATLRGPTCWRHTHLELFFWDHFNGTSIKAEASPPPSVRPRTASRATLVSERFFLS